MRSILILLILFLSVQINAQTVTNATLQNWANGTCCASGTDFSVSIELDIPAMDITLGDIYAVGFGKMDGYIYPVADGPFQNFTVSFGIRYPDESDLIIDKDVLDSEYIMPKFDGAAMITLIINRQRYEVIVDSFEELYMEPRP